MQGVGSGTKSARSVVSTSVIGDFLVHDIPSEGHNASILGY